MPANPSSAASRAKAGPRPGTSSSLHHAPERKSDRKRLAIIHAAIEVINNKSYALASMSEIAASLDLKDGTLYYYFASKQALAFACQMHSLGIFERLVDEAADSGENGITKLRSFIEGMLHDAEHNGPQLYFGDYSYLTEEQRAVVKDHADRLTQRLECFLQEGIDDGSVAPCEPQIVVQLLLGMLIWLAKWVPSINDITFDRLMSAIDLVSFAGLKGSLRTK